MKKESRRKRRAGERGQSLVEFAISMPILFLLLTAGFDMAMLLYSYNRMTGAVREAARLATESTVINCLPNSNPCNDPALKDAMEDRAKIVLHHSGINWWDAQFQTTFLAAGNNNQFNYARLRISYQPPTLFFGPALSAFNRIGLQGITPFNMTTQATSLMIPHAEG